MVTHKTPGVFIDEISTLAPSIMEVQSAIPAFIGYTEKAKHTIDDDLLLKPTKIFSIQEYEERYGGPQKDYGNTTSTQLIAKVATHSDGSVSNVEVQEPTLTYLMYYAMKMFFDNGGGQCFIVSVDRYSATNPDVILSNDGGVSVGLMDGLEKLKDEDEPTLIVIPEATQLIEDSEYKTLTEAMLKQCADLKDRFAVIDLRGGKGSFVSHDERADSVSENNSQQRNRELLGANNLEYGAAYYPFLKTSLNYYVNTEETLVKVKVGEEALVDLKNLETTNTAVYIAVKNELKRHFVKLPSSSSVAGAYVTTDARRGVWKAPANVAINTVINPLVKIDNAMQGEMSIDPVSGKSINAIRSFAGKGTFIWGARTLAGNDNEWRYCSVRRLFITVEESIKKSISWAVFEPNDVNTWVKVRGVVENYLTQKWQEGALFGATSQEAFFVRCGLGATMSSQDILEGRMNVEIGMAAIKPAEFTILKLPILMQK